MTPPAQGGPDVLLVGAGYVGGPVARALAEDGRSVTAIRRSDAREDLPGVTVRTLDLLTASASGLARTVGPPRRLLVTWAAGRTQDRRVLYLEGARRLIQAFVGEGHALEQILVTSSTSALPEVEGPVDESASDPPKAERGRVQRQAEDLWRQAGREHGVPTTVLRLAGIYGPGRELGRLYLRNPDTVQAGDGSKVTNLIHRDDAVAAVLAAVRLPSPYDGLIHVCDDDHPTRREMVEGLARARGLPLPTWEAPLPDPTTRSGKEVGNARMKRVLDLRLQHPLHLP